MANTSKPTGAPAVPATAPVKYPLARLRRDCRKLYGVSTSTFDGATYGMTGKYTVEELRAHIENWKKKGVK